MSLLNCGDKFIKTRLMIDKEWLEKMLGYEVESFGFIGTDRIILNAIGDVQVSIKIHVRPKQPIKFIDTTIGGEDGNIT